MKKQPFTRSAIALACAMFALSAYAVPTDTECLLDWAETRVPTVLTPAHQVTQTLLPVAFRYYPTTGTYFGLIGTSVFAYYQNQLTNVGTMSSLLTTARAENCGVKVPTSIVINDKQWISDGAAIYYTLEAGTYSAEITASTNGVDVSWVGGDSSCYSTHEQLTYKNNCTMTMKGQLIIKNYTFWGFGATEYVTIKVMK